MIFHIVFKEVDNKVGRELDKQKLLEVYDGKSG